MTSQQRYLPFGQVRTGIASPNSQSLITDFGYTGQRNLDSGMGGIMDYKARFYSPILGRFIQPDSLIPDPANPQAWNRFSYVSNRPIVMNDPTGHISCFGDNYDDGPQCLKKNPSAYNPKTLKDFENMSWRNRQDWLSSFANKNNIEGGWFDDMGGAIDFMVDDPSLVREGGIAEVMDAAVLQAINDGWLIHNQQNPFGGGGQGWATFFKALINFAKRKISENELISIRLQAEQDGVDYSWELAEVQDAYSTSTTLDQIYFDIFKGGANSYRSVATAFRDNPLAVNVVEVYAGIPTISGPYQYWLIGTDPRTSGPILNNIGAFGYPAALFVWGNSRTPLSSYP